MRIGWLVLGVLACRRDSPVVINEVLSNNGGAWADPAGGEVCPELDDFVELFNRSDDEVSLAGLTLTDDPTQPDKWALPAISIAAGGYVLVVADGQVAQGPLHASFAVDRDGETLWLVDGGRMRDEVELPALDADIAWGRYGDGAERFRPQRTPTPGATNEGPPDDPCLAPPEGFDDHTAPCASTREGFLALAQERDGLAVVKSDILSFQIPAERHAVLLDSRFYQLHDEWYWFRMLNGQAVEGETRFASFDGEFATVDEIYDWARGVDLATMFPPTFLRFTSTDRLYSDAYYQLALSKPRVIGVSTVVLASATEERDEIWAFELEAADTPTYDELVVWFETMAPALPAEVGPRLKWLVRSTAQEALAAQMEADDLPFADRILRYDALTRTGEVQVYQGGTVAGTVRQVRAGEPGLEDAQPTDILILEEIPDFLPPCAALITAVPQTPLAHVALLAESRGIPNLYVAGIADDPQWQSWARVRAPVALRAAGDTFDVALLSAADYDTWRTWSKPDEVIVPSIDWSTAPWAVEPTALDVADMPGWRPILGGKSAGFIALAAAGAPTPDLPLAISGRAFTVQMASLDVLAAVLALPEFAASGDPRARYLVLEGYRAFAQRYRDSADERARSSFLAVHAAGTPIGDLARGDGLRGKVAATPMLASISAELHAAVAARFAPFLPTQALRFRSSSNVEDLEGFNGAGLYESHSGYLDPEAAGEPKSTIEHAIQEVWASYWSAEAFEERHRARFDHRAGAMGVLVHAAFDDPLELANGVITLTRMPDAAPERWVMSVNAQPGPISVTNPPVGVCPEVLPEVVRVTGPGADAPSLTRVRRSTELPDADVLDDDTLVALFRETIAVAEGWLDAENARVPATQARSTLTLDLEFRTMDDGWPAWASGAKVGVRTVLKQSRSLDPSAASHPAEIVAEPIPRDLLARARTVTATSCAVGGLDLEVLQVTTDPLASPDLGYADTPFTARILVTARVDTPEIGWLAGDQVALSWLDLDLVDTSPRPWRLDVALTADAVAATGIGSITLDFGAGSVSTTSGTLAGLGTCTTDTRWADADTWLEGRFGDDS